jgi:DNA-binding transcriptional ArsR family regulator
MIKYSDRLSRTFAALADPTRRDLLKRLAAGRENVSRLADEYEVTLPAILKHVRVLEEAGLIETVKAGRVRSCAITAGGTSEVSQWLDALRAHWESRLDRLDAHLKKTRGGRR